MRRSMILVFGNRSRHQEVENLAQQSLSLSLSEIVNHFYEILEIFPLFENVRYILNFTSLDHVLLEFVIIYQKNRNWKRGKILENNENPLIRVRQNDRSCNRRKQKCQGVNKHFLRVHPHVSRVYSYPRLSGWTNFSLASNSLSLTRSKAATTTW